MPFKTILTDLVHTVPGASGAILADWEGEAVDQFARFDTFELKIIGAHKAIILSRLQEVQDRFAGGFVREAVITTSALTAIVGAVGKDYSLVMTLERAAIPGRALYHFRRAVALLAKEIY
ncbi:roadblock/LC7 domain-containing protein [Geotalea uraniireducens]|uniref:roadblock/LC7 domain-containing protein n=1 Tax=Geotalea uraniireducens TaxID=351604 RepID=UPI0024933DEB|nr:roadblock/LC7 domain-containing protein [Geotalea uraniireducens]